MWTKYILSSLRHDSEKSVSSEKITGMFVLLIEKMLEGLLDSHLRHFRTFASSFRKSATDNFDFQEKLNVKFCQGILIYNFIHKVVFLNSPQILIWESKF